MYTYALINKFGEVIDIREKPIETNPAFEVVRIYGFVEGDELKYFIVVSELRDSDDDEPYRIVVSYSAIRQTATVARLRLDNERLQQDNTRLKDALAELAESQEQAYTATQLALAEIVETIGGGEK